MEEILSLLHSVIKQKEYDKKYYAKNRDRRLRQSKEWYETNKEQKLKKCKEWQGKNPKKLAEYTKRYYQNHKEKCLTLQGVWYEDNPEYNREYYKKNKESLLVQCKEYRKSHLKVIRKKDLIRKKAYFRTENGKATHQRGHVARRTRMKGVINTLTSQEWLDILKRYDYKCAYCGVEFDCENLSTRDHVIPISKGGHNTKENVVPACRSCNSRKWNTILMEGVG